MTSMKIGVNTLFLIPGEVGGSETYLRDILRHAVDRHPGIEWVLFTNHENHESFAAAYGATSRVSLCRIPVRARQRVARILHEQVSLPRAVRRAGVDLLWSPGYTAPLRGCCPQVVSVLDMQYREFPEDLAPLARLVTGLLVPAAVRVARRVMTLSEFSREQIVAYTGCARSKIVPIHLAAGPEFAQVQGEEGVSRRRALVPDKPYILCVAHTYPHKNVHSLVEAFGRLLGRSEHVLVLVGRERRGEPLVAQALAGLEDPMRVVRLQGLARPDLIALYQGADLFVFPSLYEGFGLPVLEAMSAGVPVVTADRGPMRELGGDAVRYCDGAPQGLAGAIAETLAQTPAVREAWIQRARKRAAEFSWERAAELTVRVLCEAAGT